MSDVIKQQRYDRAIVKDWWEDDNGFFTATVAITRSGVFPYRKQDGTIQYELKHPDDLFKWTTLQSAKGKPVTEDHPSVPVTADNVKQFVKGMTHTDVRVEDSLILVTETVFDKGLIEKIKNGEKREVSIGFDTNLVPERGTYNGQEYDLRQTDIVINHIAHVTQGRAGSEVGVRADSCAWQVDEADVPTDGGDKQSNKDQEQHKTDQQEGGNKEMKKFKIDGKEYEVAEEVAQHLETLQAKADTVDAVKANMEKTEKEVQTLQGKLDAKDVEINTLNTKIEQLENAEPKQDAIDAAVNARVELVSLANKYIKDFKADGKSNKDIKVELIQVLDEGFKADSKTDEYIEARYDGAVAVLEKMGTQSVGNKNLKALGDSKTDSKDVTSKREARLNLRK